jgi:putative flippase GtrA
MRRSRERCEPILFAECGVSHPLTTRWMSLSLGQFARFVFVGGFVGVVTVACREVIGHILHADTPRAYSLSVVVAYAVGLVLSFLINHRFTYNRSAAQRNWRKFAQFVVVALIGMLITWALSLALRYGLQLDALIGPVAKPVAFAIAALLSSTLTYPLNSWFVFGESRLPDAQVTGRSP